MLKQSLLTVSVMASMYAYAETEVETSNKKAPQQLDTIVVTASGYEQTIAEAPASITVIDKEELNKKSYNDITEVLRDVPGVVINGSGSRLDVSIRGMGSAYTLFMVDGKRQNSRSSRPNGDDFGLEKGILPPIQSIERIEVIRGPMSSLYGTEAMGGVVNIITKKVPNQWGGSVEVGKTLQDHSKSGDIENIDAYVAGPLSDKVGLQVGINRYERDEDHFANGFRGTLREAVNTRLSYVLNEQHDLAFDANITKQTGKTTVGNTTEPGARAVNQTQRSYRDVFAITHNGKYSDNLNSTSYIQYEDTLNPDRVNTQGIRKPITLDTWIGNTQWNWTLGDHTLALGANFKDEKLNDEATNRNPVSNITKISRWSGALFAEDTWRLFDNFDLTGGLRWDNDEEYGSHFSPRLYGVYHLSDAFVVKGGVSTGYKQPDLRQGSSDFYNVTGGGGAPTPWGRAIIKGNSNLKPETSTTAELGVVWQGDISSASATAYHTKFKDRITEVRTCDSINLNPSANNNNVSTWRCSDSGLPFYFVSEYINVDKAIMQGVELTFDTTLYDVVNLRSNYTYTDTELKSGQYKGQPLNKMPKHMFNTTVDWDPTDLLNVWARYNYRSKESASLGRASMTAGTPGYDFFDIGANYKLSDSVTAKAGIYNAFDENVTNEDNNTVLDGRRYTLGLVATF